MTILNRSKINEILSSNKALLKSIRLMSRRAFDLRNAIQDKSVTQEQIDEFVKLIINECMKSQESDKKLISQLKRDPNQNHVKNDHDIKPR